MKPRRTFFAIRRTDGGYIYDEYAWMACDGPDDWTVAEESEHESPMDYEIVEMTARPLARRTFGVQTDYHNRVGDECDYCGEPWPCEWLRDREPVVQEDRP